MRILAFCVFSLFTSIIFSQTCCSGGVPLSNNLGLANEGKGSFSIGVSYDYNNLNTLNFETEKLDDDSRKRVTNSVLFNVGYAFTDQLSIEGLFSWVNQTRTISQFGNENFTETMGLGDAVFLLKYVMPNILGSATLLSIGAGAKAPFGESDETTAQGIQLTADLQPGSGAWDGIGWLSFSKGVNFRPSATISSSATYRFTGVNNSYLGSSSYEFGDALQINLGYTDQLLVAGTIVNPGLVFKYRKAFDDKIDDIVLPNTGGQWVFVRPEVSVQISPEISINTRFEIPIHSNVVGTQLTPTSRLTAGVFIKLNKRKNNIINSTL